MYGTLKFRVLFEENARDKVRMVAKHACFFPIYLQATTLSAESPALASAP